MLKVPIRFTAMTFENSSSGCGPSRPTVFDAGVMPAQFTSPRSVPSFSAASTAR